MWISDIRTHIFIGRFEGSQTYFYLIEFIQYVKWPILSNSYADPVTYCRNFAKRQMTWFRNELIYHWLDASKPLVGQHSLPNFCSINLGV